MRQINLLPEPLQKAQQKKMIVSSAMATVGSIVLVILVIHALLSLGMANLENQLNNPTTYKDTAEFVQLREKINAAREKVKAYLGQYSAVVEAYVNNSSTVDILRIAGTSSKHKVWFTKFVLSNKAKNCEIEGKSFNTRLVSEFMLNIKKTTFFETVDLISMEKSPDDKVTFKIVCTLK